MLLWWLHIANEIEDSEKLNVKLLNKFRWIVYFLYVVSLMVAIGSEVYEKFDGTERPNILGFTLALPGIFLVLLYLYSARKISQVLQEFSELPLEPKSPTEGRESKPSRCSFLCSCCCGSSCHSKSYVLDDKLILSLKAARKTALLASIPLGLYISSQFAYSTIDTYHTRNLGGNGWRETVHPQSTVPIAKILHLLCGMSLVLLCAVIARYVYKEYKAMESADLFL